MPRENPVNAKHLLALPMCFAPAPLFQMHHPRLYARFPGLVKPQVHIQKANGLYSVCRASACPSSINDVLRAAYGSSDPTTFSFQMTKRTFRCKRCICNQHCPNIAPPSKTICLVNLLSSMYKGYSRQRKPIRQYGGNDVWASKAKVRRVSRVSCSGRQDARVVVVVAFLLPLLLPPALPQLCSFASLAPLATHNSPSSPPPYSSNRPHSPA